MRGSRQAFQVCGDAEGVIAIETLQLEVEVENQILQHLSALVDVDVPSVQKLRKQLTSRTLDMDSARARLLYLFITLPPIHRGWGIVFERFLCLFIYFFVSLLARLRENGWTDFHEIFREGVE